MHLKWKPTPNGVSAADESADVPGLGILRIKPEHGGFRLHLDEKPILSNFGVVELAKGEADKVVKTMLAKPADRK